MGYKLARSRNQLERMSSTIRIAGSAAVRQQHGDSFAFCCLPLRLNARRTATRQSHTVRMLWAGQQIVRLAMSLRKAVRHNRATRNHAIDKQCADVEIFKGTPHTHLCLHSTKCPLRRTTRIIQNPNIDSHLLNAISLCRSWFRAARVARFARTVWPLGLIKESKTNKRI